MSRDLPEFAQGENPFSSRRVRPGALAYQFPAGVDGAALVERLAHRGWWGQIVGQHGSGKSTLLAALLPLVENRGRRTLLTELHDGQRRLPFDPATLSLAPGSVVAIDGYEQLSRWSRWRLKRACRRRALGLLVTAHRCVGLPTLFETRTDAALVRNLVEDLTGPTDESLVGAEEIESLVALHRGDLREVFFALYDLYERRRRGV